MEHSTHTGTFAAIQGLCQRFMSDSLRRSSAFLLGNSVVGSLFGFVFWLLCAHLTSSSQVGYAASLLAYINLYSTITTLGLTNAVIRFLPRHHDKDAYLSTALFINTITSLIVGSGLIEFIRLISPKLSFAIGNPETLILLLFVLVTTSVSSIADAALLAQKDAQTIFKKALWQSPIKVILPLALIGLKMRGILFVNALSAFIGTIYELVVLYRRHHQRFKIDLSSLKGSYAFTVGNFFGTIFGILPATLIPIIVLNELGASQAAYMYIALQFASLLSLICSSSAQAYLSEASNDQETEHIYHLVKAFKNLFSLLLPAALLLAVVGSELLRVYGHAYYTHASLLLILLCASSLLVGINWLGDSLLNVQKRPFAYGMMNLINALLVVVAVALVASGGLTKVGVGWFLAQAVTVLIYAVLQRQLLFSDQQLIASRDLNKLATSGLRSTPTTDYHYSSSPVVPWLPVFPAEWLLVKDSFLTHRASWVSKSSQLTPASPVELPVEAQQPVYRSLAQA